MKRHAAWRSIALPVGLLVDQVPGAGYWQRSADFDLWVWVQGNGADELETVRQVNPPRGIHEKGEPCQQ